LHELALSHHAPDLCLLSSWDYRCKSLVPCCNSSYIDFVTEDEKVRHFMLFIYLFIYFWRYEGLNSRSWAC
jgi:hypothetical protein